MWTEENIDFEIPVSRSKVNGKIVLEQSGSLISLLVITILIDQGECSNNDKRQRGLYKSRDTVQDITKPRLPRVDSIIGCTFCNS